MPACRMKAGVTSSGSPNQNASTSLRAMPALATSRIFEARRLRTASRAWSGCVVSQGRSAPRGGARWRPTASVAERPRSRALTGRPVRVDRRRSRRHLRAAEFLTIDETLASGGRAAARSDCWRRQPAFALESARRSFSSPSRSLACSETCDPGSISWDPHADRTRSAAVRTSHGGALGIDANRPELANRASVR